MKDWWTWMSSDLINWDLVSVVKPEVSVPWSTAGERDECWATDAAFRNDKWYFYLSVGPGEVGVVVADDIHGSCACMIHLQSSLSGY
jgi:beta-xylosidase